MERRNLEHIDRQLTPPNYYCKWAELAIWMNIEKGISLGIVLIIEGPKIVYPIRTGIGITGVYIDSLTTERSNKVRFVLYGENLQTENEKTVNRIVQDNKVQLQKNTR